MSSVHFFMTLGLIIGTVIVIFAMKYSSTAKQTQAIVAREDAFRDLTEKAIAAQSQNAASLASIMTDLSQVSTRLTAVEKILKDVE
jgi:predicted lactoylglutathione lyase